LEFLDGHLAYSVKTAKIRSDLRRQHTRAPDFVRIVARWDQAAIGDVGFDFDDEAKTGKTAGERLGHPRAIA
jgi:hypothetical protein